MTNTSTITTLADAEQAYGTTHYDYLDKSVEIPRVDRVAFQGDVGIVRRDDLPEATLPVPATGFPVVQAAAGGHTHALFGPVLYTESPRAGQDPSDVTLGTLTVPAGVEALLSHPEHGALLISAGTYTVLRQREQADVIRFVED